MKNYNQFTNEKFDVFGIKSKIEARKEKKRLKDEEEEAERKRKYEEEKAEYQKKLAAKRAADAIKEKKYQQEVLEFSEKFKIGKIFFDLTSITTPMGTENLMEPFLPEGWKNDAFGNYYYQIGESNTMFTSHLDTADNRSVKVKRRVKGDFIHTADSILGADDKAGATIMIHMINNNKPGLYYFFLGEERGRQGSEKLARYLKVSKDNDPIYKDINKVISFDRKGLDNLITHQMGQRCCSDKFATALIESFDSVGMKYVKDPTGSFTDSYSFKDIYPECINLSVGYYNQHSSKEIQNLPFLEELSEACLRINWDSLPTGREMKPSVDLRNYLINVYDQRELSMIERYLGYLGYRMLGDLEYTDDYPILAYSKKYDIFLMTDTKFIIKSGRKLIDINHLSDTSTDFTCPD